ncbi:DUF3750 domain-containing protein [Alsobacter sp. SYSU M60028]|uniref:DUF3750 domain-containing protein n=1 Tax=Alsobacter ponti TaxID=2962936 RepID=A0ABT1L8M7_9HYPH|nr:DUF3750 domain-containing protein [Alsobacter ponti]MCP8937837.1 DUF3750 domain-containing protein [Alsobacter ponti]
MSRLRRVISLILFVFFVPLALHAAWWFANDHPRSWSQASWSSAGLLPPPEAKPDAVVLVYAARVGRWRGIFAHHTWLVVKEKGAPRYTRFDKVGWGTPVRTDGWAPDARWFGQVPEVVAAIEGEKAEALIPRIRAAVASYPWREAGAYQAWPGPNSNTFVAHVVAAIPEAGIALPPTALGKDYRSDGRIAGLAPSHTGVQIGWSGLLGLTVGWTEGVEMNLLGLVAGLDIRRPALKLPGFGRIGLDAGPAISHAAAAPKGE